MGGTWRVRGFGGDVWLVDRSALGSPMLLGGTEEISAASAVGSLDGWFPEGWGGEEGETTLRSIGLALGDGWSGDTRDATRSLKWAVKAALRDGRLVALRPPPLSPPGSGIAAESEEPPPEDAAPAATKTWIKLKIIDDATGKPVAGVTVGLTLPDGSRTSGTSGKDGLISVDGLDPGTCDVTSKLTGAKVSGTVAFAGMGEKSGASPKPGPDAVIRAGSYVVARVERHKVKAGETLDGLAKKSGATWQELASFNWGSTPAAINEHLAADVGSTKKTADGKSYLFDGSDRPGIVFIPEAWDEGGLATEKVHTIRVKSLALTWIDVRVVDEEDWPLKGASYALTLPDESTKRSGKLDDKGHAFEEDLGPGKCKIELPDVTIGVGLKPTRTHAGETNFRALADARLATNKRWTVRYTENLTYVVHGTTPNGGNPLKDCIWSQPHGHFSRNIDGVHPGVYRFFGENGVGELGGANDHGARLRGGQMLAGSIRDAIASKKAGSAFFNKIDLVAHSHGGNVVLEALHRLASDGIKVNNVVLIATPQFRIRYKDQLLGSKKAPPWWWLYYRCDANTTPPLVSAIGGKLYNVFSAEDAVQNYWSDVSDGVSKDQIPQSADFRYELEALRHPPALAGAVSCPQATDVGSMDAHSVLHSSLMGSAVGWLFEGQGWFSARAAGGVPAIITDDDDQGD